MTFKRWVEGLPTNLSVGYSNMTFWFFSTHHWKNKIADRCCKRGLVKMSRLPRSLKPCYDLGKFLFESPNHLASAIFTSCFVISGAVAKQSVQYKSRIIQIFINHHNVYAMLACIAEWGLHRSLWPFSSAAVPREHQSREQLLQAVGFSQVLWSWILLSAQLFFLLMFSRHNHNGRGEGHPYDWGNWFLIEA